MAFPSLRGKRGERRGPEPVTALSRATEHMAFSTEIPGSDAEHPLWRLTVEVVERPEGDGERLRVRAHVRARFGELGAMARAALTHQPVETGGGRLQRVTRGLGRALAQRFESPLVQKLAAPLARLNVDTWFDVQISTAALDAGSNALLPAPEQLARLGIVPRSDAGRDAIVESWFGRSGGLHPGNAQMTLLRLDKSQLPPAVAQLLGGKPFQLAAAMVSVVEEPPPPTDA